MSESKPEISICIASHNMAHLIGRTIQSCLNQIFTKEFEIVVLDDASTDNTEEVVKRFKKEIVYVKSDSPSGTGGAFNKAMAHAKGKYIVFLCADDVFINLWVLKDICNIFDSYENIGHVTRYYFQFIHGNGQPVRAWRCNNVIELANNPSGLAFRKSAIGDSQLSNKMFVEASTLVSSVLKKNWEYYIIKWDTVAVRIHQSISRNKDYYKKRWVSSPVEEWTKVGGSAIQQDFTSLVQIANYFERSAVVKECWNFIKLRPLNLLNIGFWFYALVSICTPHWLLMKLPHWYRITIGRWTTREVKRP